MAVVLRALHKRFGDLVAVASLDLEIGTAEFFSIIGPSGCGKTTTLRMIAGFEDPTSGTIEVGGRDVTGVKPYRRPVNTVFQSYALFPHLDVYDNIAFGLREAKRPRDEVRQRVGEAIELVQLQGREQSRPQQLSGGQQQRVALARALVNRPQVLLLDEPLGALDLKLRADMQTQLKDLQRAVGITFCYVTHDQGEAFSMSDRVAVMNEGVLEQVGPPEDVYRRPQSLFVADFVGSANRLYGEVVSASAEGYRRRDRRHRRADGAGPAGDRDRGSRRHPDPSRGRHGRRADRVGAERPRRDGDRCGIPRRAAHDPARPRARRSVRRDNESRRRSTRARLEGRDPVASRGRLGAAGDRSGVTSAQGFRVVDPSWIPLSDGTRLAARIWLPTDPGHASAPAILEAIPYRRRDGTLTIDHGRYAWWAERGFAGVRLDLRGTGDSEGLIEDEYLELEHDDIIETIAWIAEQPWSNGRVGMIGYSWGGFNGLQVAARRPAALGAVVSVNSAVRRYTDDCHYTGGSVNAHDMLSWATTMLAYDARPPDPAIVGDRWREQWRARLEVAPPMIERWLSHQLEDGYWRHGSVAFDYDAIACPVLAVGGWSDPYRNAVLDLVEHLPGTRFGLLGPWAHGYPHATDPGPADRLPGRVRALLRPLPAS